MFPSQWQPEQQYGAYGAQYGISHDPCGRYTRTLAFGASGRYVSIG